MTVLKCDKTVNYASNEKLNYTFLRGKQVPPVLPHYNLVDAQNLAFYCMYFIQIDSPTIHVKLWLDIKYSQQKIIFQQG